MMGVVKNKSYTYTGENGVRGDAEVSESDNGSIRIELWVQGDHYGSVTLHHTMWAQIVRDFPGPAPAVAERVQQAIDTLLESHPLSYSYLDNGVPESFTRCPVCEQWSPCDVRILIEAYQQKRSP
jgi:hypothetical protein